MVAIVTGVGPGLGAALCRRLCANGLTVAGLSRSLEFTADLEQEVANAEGAFHAYQCDITKPKMVSESIAHIRGELGPITTLIHNAGAVLIAPFLETTAEDFKRLWETNCLGAVLTAQAVLPDMLKQRSGAIIFTGATAALRGSANFAAFAASKFALRGLAQSLAREHGVNGVHVAHVIVDGLIWGHQAETRFGAVSEACLDPDAIAVEYLNLIAQDRSAWTHELDLRPYSEKF